MTQSPVVPPVPTYPCPACGTPANLSSGCPGCGRGPDPDAAEVIALDQEIVGLNGRVDEARQTYATLDAQVRGLRLRREQIATRVRLSALSRTAPPGRAASSASSASSASAAAASAGPTGAGPTAAGGPETSTRTVQNVLFILGGLLLGTAAIVFTAIAWTTYGVTGRAAILAVLTGLALGVPALALWRGLRATAETFAGLGLLLVVLDGYAAWYVNLFGVQHLTASSYAGIVAAATAAVALAYRAATRLTGPGFAALLAMQPVLPLLAAGTRPDAARWALVYAGVATGDLVVLLWWHRARMLNPGAGRDALGALVSGARVSSRAALRAATWTFYGGALAVAGLIGLIALPAPGSTGDTARAAGAVVLVALLLVAGATLTRSAGFHNGAGAALVLAVALGAGQLVAVAWPDDNLVAVAAVAAGVAAAVALAASRLPEPIRRGPVAAGLVAAGAVGLAVLVAVGRIAVRTVGEASPAWSADLDAVTRPATVDLQLPIALALAAAALAFLLLPFARSIAGAAVALLALALPGVAALTWWAPSIVDVIAAAGLAIAATLAGRRPGAGAPGGTGARDGAGARRGVPGALALALGGYAVLAGLSRPITTAAVLGVIAVAGVTVAALDRRVVGGLALTAAFLAAPWALAAGLAAADVRPWWVARASLAFVAVLLAGLFAVRRGWPSLVWYSYLGALAAVLLNPAGSTLSGTGEAFAVYAAAALLAIAAALLVVARPVVDPLVVARPVVDPLVVDPLVVDPLVVDRPAGARPPVRVAVPAALAALPVATALALGVLLPVISVLVLPYTWLVDIWSGRPGQVGLASEDLFGNDASVTAELVPDGYDAVALGLLALAAAVAAYAIWSTRRAALAASAPVLPVAILVALAAAGAPWPTVPAVSLALGLALTLGAALRFELPRFEHPRSSHPRSSHPRLAAAQAVPGLALTGAGLAGSLATRPATLTALGLTVVAASVVGAAGRNAATRVLGWLAATAAALATAAAAALAADLPVRIAAFFVLAAAASALGVGAARHRDHPAEAVALQVGAHAGAAVALLFTTGSLRHSAAIATLWGIAVGLRALWPGTAPALRAGHASAAAACELVAWWLLLADRQVALVEAYTLPLAATALLAGWLARRTRPDLRSWIAYGPALGAAFLPGLATILAVEGEPGRRLGLGAGALLVVIGGSVRRLQAPVVIGGIVLAAVAGHELVLVWDQVPRWIPLAAGGLLLVGLAITYERRRRDVIRLRAALGRMT